LGRTLPQFGGRNGSQVTIEVHAGGRRVWPSSLKRFIKNKIEDGELAVAEVMNTCSNSRAYSVAAVEGFGSCCIANSWSRPFDTFQNAKDGWQKLEVAASLSILADELRYFSGTN